MAIEWDRVGRDEYDRSVECVLAAVWARVEGAAYHSPDGRGGDGGVDFIATTGTQTSIYQFKYFPQGLRAYGSSRKTQIRRSFNEALKRNPTRWTLVVPCKLTQTERTWVLGLGDGHEVDVDIIDRTGLDLLLAEHPEVRRYLDNKVLLQDTQDFQIMTAAVTDGEDYANKIRMVNDKAADMDLYWRPEHSFIDGQFTISARPKRPDAGIVKPIAYEVSTDSDMASETQLRAARRVLDYGANEAIEFPARVRLKSGPEFMRADGPGLLNLGPVGASSRVGERLLMEVSTPSGLPLGEHEGVITHAGTGTRGMTLELKFYRSLKITFYIDREGRGCNADVNLSLDGLEPRDVRDVLALRRQLCELTPKLKLWRDGAYLFGVDSNGPASGDDDGLDSLEGIAEDLEIVQQHTRSRRVMPLSWTPAQRLELRVARRLLEDKTVLLPVGMNPRLRTAPDLGPEGVEEIRSILATTSAAITRRKRFPLTIAGTEVDLGPVAMYSPAIEVPEAATIRALLDAGEGGDTPLTLTATKGSYWAATRVIGEDGNFDWTPTPWAIPGIDEHPGIATIAPTGARA